MLLFYNTIMHQARVSTTTPGSRLGKVDTYTASWQPRLDAGDDSIYTVMWLSSAVQSSNQCWADNCVNNSATLNGADEQYLLAASRDE